ncbi:SIS domain-containing protein [Nemania sp. FL0916]|nr:SIS domain-containing protein [Nemania sp. FL0916]
MVEHHPVHNSEVFLLGLAPRPSEPPPSPPEPLTPTDAGSSTPIEQLCLDGTVTPTDGNSTEADAGSTTARRRVAGAIHVLNTEATALRSLTQLYKTDATAAAGFNAAVDAIVRQCGGKDSDRGKLVVTGVGKSGHIGRKLVATFNSLGLPSTFLHPTEALHGDLGTLGRHDAVLFITFSGRTAELLALLPHIDASLPAIVLTAHAQPALCELIRRRPSAILLPALIHEPETVSFGVSAPTTSTTVALALGDALAVVVAQELHASVMPSVFARNHPGGAIGAALRTQPATVRDLAVPLADIEAFLPSAALLCGGDVLKAAYGSPSGWVGIGSDGIACPRRIRRLDTASMARALPDLPGLVVRRSEWINIGADTRVTQAARWIRDLLFAPSDCGEAACGEDSVLAVIDGTDVVGVLEAGALLQWRET